MEPGCPDQGTKLTRNKHSGIADLGVHNTNSFSEVVIRGSSIKVKYVATL